MELVSFAKDVIQNVAEQAASYRIGQNALRSLDRALWVVEKCARWAVPPPLDQDDRPQPELVRPLPWVFFLTMLVTLRITRESISLINLILGKPPLRSADVVMYIQSKRRYLRTLKYQGSRNIRARRGPKSEPWYGGLQALFEFTMCFRRSSYGNNNTTRVSNNEDEVLIVKRSKRTREPAGAGASTSESTMERLIEKMMVQLDADSDDDSSYTLTNATSLRSLRSEGSEFDQDTVVENHNSTADTVISSDASESIENTTSSSPVKDDVISSTPEKSYEISSEESPKVEEQKDQEIEKKENVQIENGTDKERIPASKIALSKPNNDDDGASLPKNDTTKTESLNEKKETKYSPKEFTNNFLKNERCSPQKQSPKQTFANGRAMSVPNKKKGLTNQKRRDFGRQGVKHNSADESF